jgi:hypothetical protein
VVFEVADPRWNILREKRLPGGLRQRMTGDLLARVSFGRRKGGNPLQTEKILLELDREISRLQQARNLLAGSSSSTKATGKRKPGRPAGAGSLGPEGRRRIAEAMKKSWAERKRRAAALAR